MAQIVSLNAYREQSAVDAGLRSWRRRFKEDFDARTRLNDLSPFTLCRLAEPTETSTSLFYDLIIGFLGHGGKGGFDALDRREQMLVVDIHLFLADQVRFEMMRRLGWLSRFGATHYPLFDMVRRFDDIQVVCRQDPPQLSPLHPRYAEYSRLIDRDRQVFIRRMLPSALEKFQQVFPG